MGYLVHEVQLKLSWLTLDRTAIGHTRVVKTVIWRCMVRCSRIALESNNK